MEKLHKNEKHIIDEASYIRARLFDMLIGDWDRHEDQWRWASFKENGRTIYRPIPRDRDQAFSIMADGRLLSLAITAIPDLRLMKSYREDLKSTKWFNSEPYPLDMALINQSDISVWNNQVQHITTNLTDEVINEAFKHFPNEVNDETVQEIKTKLKGRRSNLKEISDSYFQYLNKYVVIKGTNKKDWFEITRLPNGETKVTAFRIKKGVKGEIFHERTYNRNITKEIWIYGLDDNDEFNVIGDGNNLIKLRLIGGQNKDTYTINNGKKIKMYDYKSKKSNFVTNKGTKKLTDDYETNVYDSKKLEHNTNQIIPSIGSNPDDGFKIGFSNTFTFYGFDKNPFTERHKVSANYYFATNGYALGYTGEYANVIGNFNFQINANYNSPNYAVNFFDFGNETFNFEADDSDNIDVDLDFNRVKIGRVSISPALVWRGKQGGDFKIGISYESNKVEKTVDRFVSIPNILSEDTFERQDFYGAEIAYHFKNVDNEAFPTLGMETSLKVGYKSNGDDLGNGFGYIIPEFGFDYKLVSSGQVVLATKLGAQITLDDNFEFYQAANIGANNGLRGYRNQRFTGKNSFYHSTDLRLNLRKLKTGLLPLNIGVFAGMDYGRVWIENDNSNKWNNSYGGGVFFNAAGMMAFNLSAFNSDDGLRIGFKMGFGF